MGDSPEESSWTFYIEGFICDDNNNNNNKPCLSDEFESPSLVSDAASSAVSKNKDRLGFSSLLTKQISFKKQKTTIIHPSAAMDYHDLEDTASSPVNSPKDSYMNEFMKDRRSKKEKAKMDVSSQVKRNSFGKVFAVERDSELKKSD